MPVNAIGTDQLSGIEEESDIYEAFAPHVDTANISVLTDTPPGRLFSILAIFHFCGIRTKPENRWVMCCVRGAGALLWRGVRRTVVL